MPIIPIHLWANSNSDMNVTRDDTTQIQYQSKFGQVSKLLTGTVFTVPYRTFFYSNF